VSYQSITAKILIDIKAINFNFENPYTLTSGKKSPVYVDCRKIISFTNERNQIISFAENYLIENNIEFDLLAGGETAEKLKILANVLKLKAISKTTKNVF